MQTGYRDDLWPSPVWSEVHSLPFLVLLCIKGTALSCVSCCCLQSRCRQWEPSEEDQRLASGRRLGTTPFWLCLGAKCPRVVLFPWNSPFFHDLIPPGRLYLVLVPIVGSGFRTVVVIVLIVSIAIGMSMAFLLLAHHFLGALSVFWMPVYSIFYIKSSLLGIPEVFLVFLFVYQILIHRI